MLLTGGRTDIERQYGAAIEAAAAQPVTNLIGRTTLKQLLAILDRADLLICPDSGPAHMATAVGTPVVGLYATSNRHRTGPYFSQDLVVDRYPEAVQREFGVPIAQLRWGQRVRDPDAMDLIQVEDVIAKVDQVLRKLAALPEAEAFRTDEPACSKLSTKPTGRRGPAHAERRARAGPHRLSAEVPGARCPPEADLDILRRDLPAHMKRKNVSYHPEADSVSGLDKSSPVYATTHRVLTRLRDDIAGWTRRTMPGSPARRRHRHLQFPADGGGGARDRRRTRRAS